MEKIIYFTITLNSKVILFWNEIFQKSSKDEFQAWMMTLKDLNLIDQLCLI